MFSGVPVFLCFPVKIAVYLLVDSTQILDILFSNCITVYISIVLVFARYAFCDTKVIDPVSWSNKGKTVCRFVRSANFLEFCSNTIVVYCQKTNNFPVLQRRFLQITWLVQICIALLPVPLNVTHSCYVHCFSQVVRYIKNSTINATGLGLSIFMIRTNAWIISLILSYFLHIYVRWNLFALLNTHLENAWPWQPQKLVQFDAPS